MKATQAIKPSEVKRDWIVVDAAGKRFGKVLTEVATLLRGKHKPYFTPNVDCGDFVIIINAEKVEFSGTKLETKMYHRHTGYFGGVKSEKLVDLLCCMAFRAAFRSRRYSDPILDTGQWCAGLSDGSSGPAHGRHSA